MKWIAYSIWLLFSGLMCVLVFPAIVVAEYTPWFDLGNEILKHGRAAK